MKEKMKNKMKSIKKLTSLFLAAAMCFSIVACKEETPTPPSSATDSFTNTGDPVLPQLTMTETLEHKDIPNALHKVTVTESNRTFVQNGRTEYKIVTGSRTEENVAAAFIAQILQEATGAVFEVVPFGENTPWSATAKYIVVGVEELFENAGLTMPTDELGPSGYYIKSVDESVFIQTQNTFGYQRAATAFLDHVVGYEMYAGDTITFEKTGATLPTMEIIERPDYDYYVSGNKQSSIAQYGMGAVRVSDVFIEVGGETWHNTFKYLPPDVYKEAHPKWYATNNRQLCYTARGDAEEYEKMISKVVEVMKGRLIEEPTITNITFTIQDYDDYCVCEKCMEAFEYYGNTFAGAYLAFVNEVDNRIQAYLEEQASLTGEPKREFNICIFAYKLTETVPQNIICNDTVGVIIAPIYAKYNRSFYNEANIKTAGVISGWGKICKNLQMWLYETNYAELLYPFDTFDATLETYRFCRINNARVMYNEGQYMHKNVTAFGRLKEYFNSKALFDLANCNFSEVVDDFFVNYFKDAAVPMRQYFDELQACMKYLQETYPAKVSGDCTQDQTGTREYWPREMLNNWLGLINQGYASIEKYKESDPDLYKVLALHLKIESIFPRFALIDLHDYTYSAKTLQEMRIAFKADCDELGIVRETEHSPLSNLFKTWGLN